MNPMISLDIRSAEALQRISQAELGIYNTSSMLRRMGGDINFSSNYTNYEYTQESSQYR